MSLKDVLHTLKSVFVEPDLVSAEVFIDPELMPTTDDVDKIVKIATARRDAAVKYTERSKGRKKQDFVQTVDTDSIVHTHSTNGRNIEDLNQDNIRE